MNKAKKSICGVFIWSENLSLGCLARLSRLSLPNAVKLGGGRNRNANEKGAERTSAEPTLVDETPVFQVLGSFNDVGTHKTEPGDIKLQFRRAVGAQKKGVKDKPEFMVVNAYFDGPFVAGRNGRIA